MSDDDGEIATAEEVSKEFGELSSKYKKTLHYAAFGFGKALRWFDQERFSADGLISEALIATLSGARPWRKKVPLFRHLIGAMKSICSNEAKKLQRRNAPVEAAMTPSGRGVDETAEHEDLSRDQVDAEQKVILDERIGQIRDIIAGDQVALDVFDGFLERMKPMDIQDVLEIDRNEYERAAVKIRRAIAKVDEGGY